MKKIVILLVLFITNYTLISQNLVSNGDFSSQGSGCNIKDFANPPASWSKASVDYSNDHTPDFYHTCAGVGNPNYPAANWNGCSNPLSGAGYVGLLAFPSLNSTPFVDHDFEYIQQTISTLSSSTTYYIEFYVKPASGAFNHGAVKTLGMYLTDDLADLQQPSDDDIGLHHLLPQIRNSSAYYNDATHWTKISGTFNPPSSGYKYIVIGNFDSGINYGSGTVSLLPGESGSYLSYYYIDGVTIIPNTQTPPTYGTISGPDLLCTSGTYTLQNGPTTSGITWSVNPSNIATPSSGTGTSASISNTGNGSGTISFKGNCGTLNIASMEIHSGTYSSSDYPISGPSTASSNQYVYYSIPQLQDVTAINWTWPSGWTYVSGQNSRYLALKTGQYGGMVAVGVNNTCGQSGSYATKYTTVYGGYGYSASPNPADNTLIITAVEEGTVSVTDMTLESSSQPLTTNEINYGVALINDQMQIVKTGKLKKGKVKLNVASLPNGLYVLHIYEPEGTVKRQILIQH